MMWTVLGCLVTSLIFALLELHEARDERDYWRRKVEDQEWQRRKAEMSRLSDERRRAKEEEERQ